MVIGIAARMLCVLQPEGIGIYAFEVLKRCVLNHPEHQFIFFIHNKKGVVLQFEEYKNVTLHLTGFAFHWVRIQELWYNLFLSKQLIKTKCDILFSPNGLLPYNLKIKTVAVIHDLNFETGHHYLPASLTRFYKKQYKKSCEQAHALIAVSHFTKSEIIKYYAIDENKINVIYNGASPNFIICNELEKQNIKNIYSQGAPYFLCPGAIHERKNINNLLQAFDIYKSKTNAAIKLLFTGKIRISKRKWQSLQAPLTCKADVLHAGYLPQKQLVSVFGSACALVYISSYEGFGLPLAEAMQCAVPVLTSQSSSLCEIGGDAVLTCNEKNVESIALQMENIAANAQLRNILIENGTKRVAFFNWDNCANNVWKIIEHILNNKK